MHFFPVTCENDCGLSLYATIIALLHSLYIPGYILYEGRVVAAQHETQGSVS